MTLLLRTDVDRQDDGDGIPRPIEAALAGVGLVVVSPLLAAVALVVRLSSPGPVLFRQERVGRRGARFTLVKFRTMRVNDASLQVTAVGDSRITRVGRWLRKLKLDELPELWNVLCGDMSLVGPRPEVPRYVDESDSLWRQVLRVRPGITDPVTIRLRNEEELIAASPEDREHFYLKTLQRYKLAGYLEYLRERSFWSDVGVLLQTGLVVLVPSTARPPSVDEVATKAAALASGSGEVSGE